MEINIKADIHTHSDVALHEVRRLLEQLMATLQDYITQQTVFNDEMAADVSALSDKLTAINGDVTTLNQKISDLNALLASGNLTTEQQAALDTVLAASQAVATKIKSATTDASDIDDRTPPAPPTP